jgi:ABC-type sugar transport system ATPase subunit
VNWSGSSLEGSGPGEAPGPEPHPAAAAATSVSASAQPAREAPVIEARGIVKTYGAVLAVDQVDFVLRQGEIVGIVGDNGAGKSTLIKILSGAAQPDAGTILIDGQEMRFSNPKEAKRLGIETVYQDLGLFDDLSVAANIFVGREMKRYRWFLDHRGMLDFAREVILKLKVDVPDARADARNLSGGQRQAVAVARSVAFGTRIVILDEPTSALSRSASEKVLDIIRDLKRTGLSVILISHDLEHVLEVAERIVVMRQGRVAGVVDRKDVDVSDVVHLMVAG